MTTLTDTVRIDSPKRSPVRPAAPLDPSWDNASESRHAERPFDLASRMTQWDRSALGRGKPFWREAGMTTLTDTVRIEAPKRSPVKPAAPLDNPRDATESRPPERSFEVESRGGYARTVVGRVAYLDDEAQAYMVLTRAGMLVRVPLRDITSSSPVTGRRSIVSALSKLSSLRAASTLSSP